jgi:hypothetical protein
MDITDIEAWNIYFAPNCNHARPKPKDKYVVVAYVSKNAWGFLINSEVSKWLRERPKLLVCEAVILAAEHRCLKRDSYADCQIIYEFFGWELRNHEGVISRQAKINILQSIKGCPTLETRHKSIILENERDFLNNIEGNT